MKTNGDMEKYSCCNTSVGLPIFGRKFVNNTAQCAAFCGMACVGLSWILPLTNRGDVREKYDLAGNDCKDCLCTCFCGLCDISQQDKEVEYRERQNKSLLDQPGKVDSMNYRAEWTQPQPHSYYG